ncbi:MAG: arginine ABC transporter substrate-binding protein [Rickettsiales bacterium]|nr:MAG: arginine ABC transporter substrate-binding protein [Rickettsiales bacterium]
MYKKVLLIILAILSIILVDCKKGEKKLIVATNARYTPFEFIDKDNNIIGFDIDIIQAIAAEIGVEIEIKDVKDIIGYVSKNKADIGIGGITISEWQKSQVNFSAPYYTSGIGIVVRSDSNNTTLDSLTGKKIGAQNGTTAWDIAEKIPDAELLDIQDVSDLYIQLELNKIDAVIGDVPVNDYYIAVGGQGKIKKGDQLSTKELGFITRKNNPKLAQEITRGLNIIKGNGKYFEIYNKWFKNNNN